MNRPAITPPEMATPIPIAVNMQAASAHETKITRRARSRRPAPTQAATIVVVPTPKASTRDEMRSSTRDANPYPANPLPVLMKIDANIDATYDVQIKNFTHEGIEYIGIPMLCPNTALKSAKQREMVSA